MTKPSNNTGLLIFWVLATISGPFVGFVFLFGCLAYDSYNWTAIVPMSLVVIGILMGICQWAVLKKHLKNAWAWIPLTAIGFLLGVFLGLILSDTFDAGDWNPSMPMTVGTVLGIAQWPVFARQVKKSLWWIPVSILSWTVGMGISLAAFDYLTSDYTWVNNMLAYGAGLGLLLGILVGLVSGVFLVSLLNRSNAQKKTG